MSSLYTLHNFLFVRIEIYPTAKNDCIRSNKAVSLLCNSIANDS
jgi:hypothetical protein